MKNLDLSNYGVQEMNAVEMQEVDGGVIPYYHWSSPFACELYSKRGYWR